MINIQLLLYSEIPVVSDRIAHICVIEYKMVTWVDSELYILLPHITTAGFN